MAPFNKMWKFMQIHNATAFVKNGNDEAMSKIRQGNYAYITESSSIDYLTER